MGSVITYCMFSSSKEADDAPGPSGASRALYTPEFKVDQIAHYWDSNNIEKTLKNGTFNRLSDDEWTELDKQGRPYLIAMVQRMKMGENEAYDFFERGPKAFALCKAKD